MNVFALLILALLALVLIVKARKGALRAFARVLRYPFKPLIRLLRPAARRLNGAPVSAGGAEHLGQNAWVAFARFFIWQSESETALAENELNMHIALPARGLLFKWIDVSDHELPDSSLKVDDTMRNVENAHLFYGQTEDIFANPGNLFEDIEAAFIIKMFRNSDAGFFHVLTELRKQINANVRDFAVWSSFILVAVLLFNVFLPQLMTPAADVDPNTALFLDNETLVALASCALGTMLMLAAYSLAYTHHQRNNGMQLNNFVQRYLSHLNRLCQESQRHAGAEQLDQRSGNVEELVKSAGAWFVNFQWTAMRVFFIESFVRNILFQVRRNSGFYAFYVPAGFLAFVVLIAAVLNVRELDVTDHTSRLYHMSLAFYAAFLAMAFVFLKIMALPVDRVLEQIKGQAWERFNKMNLQDATQTLVQRDKREIANWKNRFRNELA